MQLTTLNTEHADIKAFEIRKMANRNVLLAAITWPGPLFPGDALSDIWEWLKYKNRPNAMREAPNDPKTATLLESNTNNTLDLHTVCASVPAKYGGIPELNHNKVTYVCITINWIAAIDTKIINAQMRSYLKCGSGCARYIASRGLLRYHMVIGFNSVGGPKQLKLAKQRLSGGNKFDSIIAILCSGEIVFIKKLMIDGIFLGKLSNFH